VTEHAHSELARLGTATVYEASGRRGLIDAPLIQVVRGSRAAGPARTVRCGQDDNLMVHAAMARLEPGEILVLTMPSPTPVALVGDLLATQAKVHGAAAVLVDAAVRDLEELVALGLPVWTRYVRVRGADKATAGALDVTVEVGGATIRPGDVVVLDADGGAVVEHERVDEVLDASLAREEAERVKRAKLQDGALSYERDGLRAIVEEAGAPPPPDRAHGSAPPGGGAPWA
jgi:4-hydroxy-4-methyl-2-oxoglutarate aldolase